jgi:ABC-2 type transport system permease protein
MIWTILQTSLRRLKNNRSELVLTFVVPILFFSIFAVIFGSRGSKSSGTPRIKVALSDQSNSAIAKRAIELLAEQPSLRITDQGTGTEGEHASGDQATGDEATGAASPGSSITVDRAKAEDLVRRGLVSAAVVFSPAPQTSLRPESPSPESSAPTGAPTPASRASDRMPTIEVMSDSFDQVASQVLTAVVQRAVMMAAAEQHKQYFAEQPQGISLASATLPLPPTSAMPSPPSPESQPPAAPSTIKAIPTSHAMATMRSKAAARLLESRTAEPSPASGDDHRDILPPNHFPADAASRLPSHSLGGHVTGGLSFASPVAAVPSFPEPPSVITVDVLGGKKTNPVIAMYAAGIAVMFLLFSATTASGSLLEERENSTLDRLLCSRLSMDQLLLGKWAYLTLIGMLQMTLMFFWGSLVFGIELLRHWEGFVAMTLVTSGAAASFALFLASMCRTRTQLGWVSTIVILTMSALGGSMVPRYLMSETIQRVGLVTFNAWALEGFNKIFWRDLQLKDIELELSVLTLCAFCFIVAARMFAIRWERS